MNDDQMLRYARHIMLEQFGFEGQVTLLQSSAALIGVGGLGSSALAYLASAGIGQLELVDHDTVELSNLQRQIAHNTHTLGRDKVASAAQFVRSLNPEVQISTWNRKLTEPELLDLAQRVDIVLDCTDNDAVRQMINRACLQAHTPWVSAAAIKYSGQISCFDFRKVSSPCYACLYSPEDALPVDNCATLGVFAPLLGVMGSMQAAEAIKMLLNIGAPLSGRLLMYDALRAQWQSLKLPANPDCPVCGGQGGSV